MSDLSDIIRHLYGYHDDSLSRGLGPEQGDGSVVPITLSENSKRLVIAKYNPHSDDGLCEHTIKTIMDAEGPKTVETTTAYRGACGHLIIGLNEQNSASGICGVCEGMICSQCLSNRCVKCGALVCDRCSISTEEEVFCVNCRASHLLRKNIHSFLKAIHGFLSKEF